MASFFILTPNRFSRNFHFSYYIASIAELSTAIQENARHHLGDAGHFYAFKRSAATATTAIRHAAAIVAITVIRQQDQHDGERVQEHQHGERIGDDGAHAEVREHE